MKIKCVLLILLAICSINQGYACHSCKGNPKEKQPNLAHPGCEQLNFVVHNMTAYTFKLDTSYNADKGQGEGSFQDILPDANQGGGTSISFVGAAVDDAHQDEITRSMRYIATLNDRPVGTGFTIQLRKNSCNAANTRLIYDDRKCYSQGPAPECKCSFSANATSCKLCTTCHNGLCSTSPCDSDYHHYRSYDCKNSVNSADTYSASSSVSIFSSGIYTLGVSSNDGPDFSQSITNVTNFECNEDSIRNASSDYNSPAETKIYIYASPIEKLTISFPFNSQSPIGKIMRDVIYNNLDTVALASLDNYYSMNPVSVKDASISFSTLCNSNLCPKKP